MIVSLLFAPLLLVLGLSQAAIDSLNLAEYQELCKFIQILEADPEIPKIIVDGTKEDIPTLAGVLLDELELLNVSTAEGAVFDLLEKGEKFKEASTNPVVKIIGDEKWTKLVGSWKVNNEKKPEDPAKVRRIQNPRACETAHRQIGKILGQAENEEARIRRLESLMTNNVYEARRHMYSAIYGVEAVREQLGDKVDGGKAAKETLFGQLKADKKSFGDGSTGTYASVCGNDGAGTTHPGTSIVSDMTCLCADKAAASGKQYCGSTVTSALSGDFGANDLAAAGTAYKGHCTTVRAVETAIKPSPESLHGIISRFRAMLGKNTISISSADFASGNQKFAQFILGAFVSGTSAPHCEGTADLTNGKTTQKGICVNYGTFATNKKEIPWVDQIQKAAGKLQENEKIFALQLSLLRKLENLKSTAEIYYENALQILQDAPNTAMSSPTATKSGPQAGSLASGDQDSNRSGSHARFRVNLPYALALLTLLAH